MATTHKNRVQMTVTSVASAGLGTITLNAAASGYQSLASAYGADAVGDFLFVEGTAWEVARDCAYTHSGTTLSRGTLEASSTGSAITLTSAAVVSQIAAAEVGNRLERAMQAVMPGGRLTLTTGTPVTTSDVTGATTIYYTPYVHDTIPLWDGSRWVPTTFAEASEALGTLTSGLPYDVFGFLSSGVLDLEKLAWTNGTTRATAVTLQDGRYCKSGDKTRLLLGTFYTTATTTTEDSITKRFVSNIYNAVQRKCVVSSATAHSYNGGYRYWNNDSTLRVQIVVSQPSGIAASFGCSGEVAVLINRYGICGQKLDASNSYDGVPAYLAGGTASNVAGGVAGVFAQLIPTGYHYIAATQSSASSGATDFNSINLSGSVLA